MDRLFKSNWFVKIISFLIALMLYTVVSSEQHQTINGNSVTKENQVTIKEQLQVKYDANKFVASGFPTDVMIQVTGNSNIFTKAGLMLNRKAFIDLNGKSAGTYSVKVQTQGFPSGLTVNVIPSSVTVNLEKKITKKMSVNVDVVNESKVQSGYKVGKPVLTPEKVTVTGGEKEVNSVSFIKGSVDVTGVNNTLNKRVALHAYDSSGNQIDTVDVKPSVFNVQVPITNPSKQVPLSFSTKGTVATGYAISSIKLNPDQVSITGPLDKIDNINQIDNFSIPVDGLSSDKTLSVNIPNPTGVEKVNPTSVEATVNIVKATTMELTAIPVDIIGLQNNDMISFKNPSNQTVTVTLTGAPSVLAQVTRKDIEVSIDVSQLQNSGNYTLKPTIKVPQFCSATLKPNKVKITYTKASSTSGGQ